MARQDDPQARFRAAFTPGQLSSITQAVRISEELVSNRYKMSTGQWLRPKYDLRTLAELEPGEIIDGPFAQIIRYKGQPQRASLGSATYDLYRICLQDHTIMEALNRRTDLELLPFAVYITTHELVHIVRFSRFLQGFDASPDERLAEEMRVHERTHGILSAVRLRGLPEVLDFFKDWRASCEKIDCTP
ncbi:MAG: hypothetical protein R6V84_07930 [Desulfobacterales bacterium]